MPQPHKPWPDGLGDRFLSQFEIAERDHYERVDANEMKQWRRSLKGNSRMAKIILLVIGLLIPTIATIQSCAGDPTDMPYPFDPEPIVVWIPGEADNIHPGIRESFALNLDRWCVNRGECRASIRNAELAVPGDWIVTVGGTYPNLEKPQTIAQTDYIKKQFYFYSAKSDGTRIFLVPPGECRKVRPPHQTDVELDVVVGHELGHMFGYPDLADNADSIMRGVARCDDMRP